MRLWWTKVKQLLAFLRRKLVNFCRKFGPQGFIGRKPQVSDVVNVPLFLRQRDVTMQNGLYSLIIKNGSVCSRLKAIGVLIGGGTIPLVISVAPHRS